MLVSPPVVALLQVLLPVLAVLAGTPAPAPGAVPGLSPAPIPSPGTGPGARSVPSLPVPATASAPLPFLDPDKQKLHLCSGFPPQAMAAAKTFLSPDTQSCQDLPPDTQSTYRWSLLLCLPCLSALGIRASSSFRASAATLTSSSSSIFCKNRKLLPLSAKGLTKSLSQRIHLQNYHHTCIYLERMQDKK